ncbi:MAG: non-canonical purine NTP pyrophosphatase [Verrucomicrobia bacterium]|nr:non-canonical purine NTP pyrophosphatase [Verrucomicrobiota bacterium]
MNDRQSTSTLIIATRNAHKVGEIRAILGNDFRYLTLKDFPDAPSVIENADTFAGNATKKALELAHWLKQAGGDDVATRNPEPGTWNIFVLADDSGLEVDALDGKPGVHSARFAALDSAISGNSTDADNNAKLLRLLENVPQEKRAARFRCVIALAVFNPSSFVLCPEVFEGWCEGRIGPTPRGNGGFGYDPLFIPEGFELSFAELGEDVKNRLSHRAKALQKLHQYFRETGIEGIK